MESLSRSHILLTVPFLQADTLELKVTFATRDKENAEHSYSSLQRQYEHLASQQTHWDDLRRTSEQIDHLTNLIGQADNEELNELRRARDRSKVLEGEHAALQKRFKEQENRSAANEKAVSTIKQSLSQSQARASEWEKRAKESEAKLERTTTQLEQAEQTHSQLDADYLVVKMQLEDREADERLSKVCDFLVSAKRSTLISSHTRIVRPDFVKKYLRWKTRPGSCKSSLRRPKQLSETLLTQNQLTYPTATLFARILVQAPCLLTDLLLPTIERLPPEVSHLAVLRLPTILHQSGIRFTPLNSQPHRTAATNLKRQPALYMRHRESIRHLSAADPYHARNIRARPWLRLHPVRCPWHLLLTVMDGGIKASANRANRCLFVLLIVPLILICILILLSGPRTDFLHIHHSKLYLFVICSLARWFIEPSTVFHLVVNIYTLIS